MKNNEKPEVLCVGHCSFDSGNLANVLTQRFGAEVKAASTANEAFDSVRNDQFDLVLVNRVFDADGDSGLEFVKRLQAHEETRNTPVMLVSNYPEAQEAAVALGARLGFGKQALGAPEMLEPIKAALQLAPVRAESSQPNSNRR